MCIYYRYCLGVTLQTRKIPIRFFVEKIREGYQVIFTGKYLCSVVYIHVYTSQVNVNHNMYF